MFKQINQIRPLFDRQDQLRYLGLLVMMVIGACLDVVGIGAIPAFVASLAMPEKVFAFPYVGALLNGIGITTSKQLVIWGAIGLIVVFICKNMYMYAVYTLQVRTTEYHRVRLSTRLFTIYMHAPWEFHLQKNSAELQRNVMAETQEIMNGIINPMLSLTMGAMMTLFTVLLLVTTTPGIAMGGVAMIGVSSWLFLRIFNKKLIDFGERAKRERKHTILGIKQGLSGLKASRVAGRESHFIDYFHRSIAKLARVTRLRQVIKKASPSMLEMVAVTGLMCIVLVLVVLGNEPAALVPMLALYGAAIARLRQSISQIVSSIGQIQYSKAAIPTVIKDVKELEEYALGRIEAQNNPSPFAFEGSIRFENVSYSYPDAHKRTLNNINLTIRKGESVAFVGETGSGKSTLINLLLGLMKPQEGAITIDGVDIHSNMQGWLGHVGYIPQDIVLLDNTVRNNVAIGIREEEIDDAQVWKVLDAAQLGESIRNLPDGLNTIVGERGVRFSGGQIQRVGLARALYTNPDVLVMDEATSALDNRTESNIMKTLEELKDGRTFIMIAHRLSTVAQCDQLFFLEGGTIGAGGTYDDLSRKHHNFRRMVELV